MIWNEPNNKSHWDFEQLDPDWRRFGDMVKLAAGAIASESPRLPRVLGGISPIDPNFIANMQSQGVLDVLDVVAVHGFPLDWDHWQLNEWPAKLAEIRAVTQLPVWVSEVGVSSFGAEQVTSIWGWFARTALRSWLRARSPSSHRTSAFVNGFTSRIRGSMMRYAGSRSWA
jgi:beta-xylosidase